MCTELNGSKEFANFENHRALFYYDYNNNINKWYTHMPKPVYEEGDVTVVWNQAVQTDREVTANRPDKIIKDKKKKRENIHTDGCGNTRRQKCCAKWKQKRS